MEFLFYGIKKICVKLESLILNRIRLDQQLHKSYLF